MKKYLNYKNHGIYVQFFLSKRLFHIKRNSVFIKKKAKTCNNRIPTRLVKQ